MSNNSGDSAPLIHRNRRDGLGFNFPQQGSIDWAAIGKSSASFTVEVLSRMSKAGIEALSLYAAYGIFRQASLSSIGQKRINQALETLRSYSSMNKALWFGVGVKHIIRNLSESTEGLACIGISACLGEAYSLGMSARILQELFLLYRPPADLTPALHQWSSLVEACKGVVAETEFGLLVSRLSSMYFTDGMPNSRMASKPEAIARALKGLFDVSSGSLERIHIAGGPDCAWLTAVAHWLLSLTLQVEDKSGSIVYRPGISTEDVVGGPQVTISCVMDGFEQSAIVQKVTMYRMGVH